MLAVIYRWKLRDGVTEEAWLKNWSDGTKYTHQTYGSLGSSLHRAADGTFWAYARWPSREQLEKMRTDSDAGTKPYSNKSFVEQVGEPITLDLLEDQLKFSK